MSPSRLWIQISSLILSLAILPSIASGGGRVLSAKEICLRKAHEIVDQPSRRAQIRDCGLYAQAEAEEARQMKLHHFEVSESIRCYLNHQGVRICND